MSGKDVEYYQDYVISLLRKLYEIEKVFAPQGHTYVWYVTIDYYEVAILLEELMNFDESPTFNTFKYEPDYLHQIFPYDAGYVEHLRVIINGLKQRIDAADFEMDMSSKLVMLQRSIDAEQYIVAFNSGYILTGVAYGNDIGNIRYKNDTIMYTSAYANNKTAETRYLFFSDKKYTDTIDEHLMNMMLEL